VEKILHLVGEIYEASYRPEHWDNVMETLCTEVLDCRSGGIFLEDFVSGTRSTLGFFGLPKMTMLAYRFGMSKYDHTFRLQKEQGIGSAREIINAPEVKQEHPLYYRLILKPNDIGSIAGINIFNDEEWHVGLGLHRSFSAERFGEAQLNTLDLLYPHFKRAIRIHREFHQLRTQQQTLKSVMSQLMIGLVIVDAQGAVQYSNPVADAILGQHQGLSIRNGYLRAHHEDENAQLFNLVAKQAAADLREVTTKSHALGLHHPNRQFSLTVMAAPLNEGTDGEHVGGTNGHVALYLSDAESSLNVPAEALRSLYALTPAEAGIAISLVNGLSVNEMAAQNVVSPETVRAQLKSVFNKMGVNKQQDVIRILLGSAVRAGALN
jgi:DNA-binding CsgD family transcriptional regulator/PAS domain-containing protein